jgi:hypothetical protein
VGLILSRAPKKQKLGTSHLGPSSIFCYHISEVLLNLDVVHLDTCGLQSTPYYYPRFVKTSLQYIGGELLSISALFLTGTACSSKPGLTQGSTCSQAAQCNAMLEHQIHFPNTLDHKRQQSMQLLLGKCSVVSLRTMRPLKQDEM